MLLAGRAGARTSLQNVCAVVPRELFACTYMDCVESIRIYAYAPVISVISRAKSGLALDRGA